MYFFLGPTNPSAHGLQDCYETLVMALPQNLPPNQSNRTAQKGSKRLYFIVKGRKGRNLTTMYWQRTINYHMIKTLFDLYDLKFKLWLLLHHPNVTINLLRWGLIRIKKKLIISQNKTILHYIYCRSGKSISHWAKQSGWLTPSQLYVSIQCPVFPFHAWPQQGFF